MLPFVKPGYVRKLFKERLETNFDRILEIRIDNARTRRILEFSEESLQDLSPYGAFCAFFKDMNGRELTEAEDMMLKEVLQAETEAEE